MQPVNLSCPGCVRTQLTHGMFNCYIKMLLRWESSKFVKLVRKYNNGELHYRFKQILKYYLIQQRSDVDEILSRIEQLVEDHTELREGFKSLQMAVKATKYIKKIKSRLAVSGLLRYFKILQGFYSGQTSMVKMVEEMGVLFADHEDLFAEFCEFSPESFNLSE